MNFLDFQYLYQEGKGCPGPIINSNDYFRKSSELNISFRLYFILQKLKRH